MAREIELTMHGNVPHRMIGRRLRKARRQYALRRSKRVALDALALGSGASVLSALALMVCSGIEEGSVAGGLNGPSQWLWGEDEAYTRKATMRHTAAGYSIHHLTSVFWAGLHTAAFGGSRAHRSSLRHCAEAAATTGTAYFVDYYLTPRRFRPGFEKHLSGGAMFVVYAAFAAGLALTAIARDR